MLRTISKPIVKGLHVFLHTATLALVATALSAMIEFKNGMKFPHLYSAHSWFGLIVAFLYVCQVQLSRTFPIRNPLTNYKPLTLRNCNNNQDYHCFATTTLKHSRITLLNSILMNSIFFSMY